MKTLLSAIIALLLPFSVVNGANQKAKSQDENILNFLNLKFGMFIHYNMGTYYAQQWAYPFNDPKAFKPSELDCNQWAAAAKSAGMTYGVFTTKHHDGFCLWNSKTTNYDIASADRPYNKLDIVKQYTDAFRKAGLTVGLYFSVWDRHQGVQKGNINKVNIDFTKEQLTELLTNYGEIACIVIDGWGSVWGKGPDFDELPYNILADHIHSIQPNCLVINHSCRVDTSSTQITHYEATHGQHIPYDNVYPSQQGPVIQPTWFWEKGYEKLKLKPTQDILNEIAYTNIYFSNYLLNAAPNDKGLMDDNVVARLKEVGQNLKLSAPLKKLPKLHPVHQKVKVTYSSIAKGDKIENRGVIDSNLFTRWQASPEDKEPWIMLDFGKKESFNFISMHGGYGKEIQEHIVEAFINGKWQEVYKGGVITFFFKKHFKEVTAQKYRLRVTKFTKVPKLVEVTFVKY